ncbi:MAG: RNA polymerase sigma factor [Erythrobacter sp.]|nr:RNA polymerase sigma factor [Erythrobacter sp.]
MNNSPHPDPAPNSGAIFDELLVVLVAQGDGRAMERLHARWTPRLARAALRYTGDPEIARDLVQECWIGIWKGIPRLRDPARFRSYAFGVLHRQGADFLRGAIRERNTASARALDDYLEPPAAPAQGDGIALQQAFSALPPDQRFAAHLYFVEGLTLREIAEAAGIAEGTAKSRLFHARRKLKAALGDTYPEPTQGEPL